MTAGPCVSHSAGTRHDRRPDAVAERIPCRDHGRRTTPARHRPGRSESSAHSSRYPAAAPGRCRSVGSGVGPARAHAPSSNEHTGHARVCRPRGRTAGSPGSGASRSDRRHRPTRREVGASLTATFIDFDEIGWVTGVVSMSNRSSGVRSRAVHNAIRVDSLIWLGCW